MSAIFATQLEMLGTLLHIFDIFGSCSTMFHHFSRCIPYFSIVSQVFCIKRVAHGSPLALLPGLHSAALLGLYVEVAIGTFEEELPGSRSY